jgi:hypothetical protein
MDKDEMIKRIKRATPHMDAILGSPPPTEEMFMNERQMLEMNAAITEASKHYDTLTDKAKIQITMGLQMAWWSLQKLNGDHVPEEDTGGPKPTKEQVAQVYQYLSTP